MRPGAILLSACILGCLLPDRGRAIIIDTEQGSQESGNLVSQDDQKGAVRRRPGASEKVEEFERGEIKTIHQVDLKRLAELRKENPKAYREYAEELTEKRADPEARELALRLLVI